MEYKLEKKTQICNKTHTINNLTNDCTCIASEKRLMSIPLLDEQVMVYKHLDESVSSDQDTER